MKIIKGKKTQESCNRGRNAPRSQREGDREGEDEEALLLQRRWIAPKRKLSETKTPKSGQEQRHRHKETKSYCEHTERDNSAAAAPQCSFFMVRRVPKQGKFYPNTHTHMQIARTPAVTAMFCILMHPEVPQRFPSHQSARQFRAQEGEGLLYIGRCMQHSAMWQKKSA